MQSPDALYIHTFTIIESRLKNHDNGGVKTQAAGKYNLIKYYLITSLFKR